MPSAARAGVRRIRDASDFGSTPGAGNTGYPVVWDNAQGKFVLSDAIASAITTHVGLADPHTQYALESALGTAALLNVGTSANNIVQLDGSARLPAVDGSQLTGISGGGTPGGSTTQVQFNDAGAFGGDAGLTYAKATDRLTVAGGLIAGDWSPPSDSTTAVSIWNAARSSRVVTVDTTNSRLISNQAIDSVVFLHPNTAGRMRLGDDVDTKGILSWNSGGVGIGWNLWVNNGAWMVGNSASAQTMLRAEAGTFNFYARASGSGAPSSRMKINSSGVVIGSNPSELSANGALDVFAGAIYLRAATATADGQIQGRLTPTWISSVQATRQGRVSLYVDDYTNTYEMVRCDAPGAGTAYVALVPTAGHVAIGQTSATALLDLAASTTARASLRIRSGTAPTSPNDGDIWFNGTNFQCRIGGVTRTFTVT